MDILRGALLFSLVVAVATPQYVPKGENDPNEKWLNRNQLHQDLQDLLVQQVSKEMEASLVYMAMSSNFGNEKINRPGFTKLFKEASDEEREHAQKLIEYLGKRGSQLDKLNIKMPAVYEWKSGIAAFTDAIKLENHVTDKLMEIHTMATDLKDAHLTDFLENVYLGEQIESIRELVGLQNNLRDMSHKDDGTKNAHDKLAEYLFDLELQKKSS